MIAVLCCNFQLLNLSQRYLVNYVIFVLVFYVLRGNKVFVLPTWMSRGSLLFFKLLDSFKFSVLHRVPSALQGASRHGDI